MLAPAKRLVVALSKCEKELLGKCKVDPLQALKEDSSIPSIKGKSLALEAKVTKQCLDLLLALGSVSAR